MAVEQYNVRFVLTTGDNVYAGRRIMGVPIGDHGDEDDDWFFTFFQPYRYMVNRVPVYPCIGNHDTGAVCVGGSACPGANANLTVRVTTQYNKAFPVSRFPNVQAWLERMKALPHWDEVSSVITGFGGSMRDQDFVA